MLILDQVEQFVVKEPIEIKISYVHIRPLKLLNFEKCPKEMENKLKDIGQKYDVLFIFLFF